MAGWLADRQWEQPRLQLRLSGRPVRRGNVGATLYTAAQHRSCPWPRKPARSLPPEHDRHRPAKSAAGSIHAGAPPATPRAACRACAALHGAGPPTGRITCLDRAGAHSPVDGLDCAARRPGGTQAGGWIARAARCCVWSYPPYLMPLHSIVRGKGRWRGGSHVGRPSSLKYNNAAAVAVKCQRRQPIDEYELGTARRGG